MKGNSLLVSFIDLLLLHFGRGVSEMVTMALARGKRTGNSRLNSGSDEAAHCGNVFIAFEREILI